MVKNRLVFSMVVILLTLIIIGLVAVIIYFKLENDSGKQSIDEVVASSWETKSITANTNNNQFVKIQFQFQLDSKKASKEIEKRDFQVYDIIYKALSDMNGEDFIEKEKLANFEKKLIADVNDILDNGEVIDIYTIEKIIQ